MATPVVLLGSAWLLVYARELAVDLDPAALAEVADHVPVDRRLVDASGVRVAAADREVDGAADLLVEQDLTGSLRDAVVGADPELAQAAGAGIGVEHLDQEILAALGARVPVGCNSPIRDDFDDWYPRQRWLEAPVVLYVQDSRFEVDPRIELPGRVVRSVATTDVLRGGVVVRTIRVTRLDKISGVAAMEQPGTEAEDPRF